MSFRFRFETVLTVKNRREEEKRHQLAAEERRLAKKDQQLKGIEEAKQEEVGTFLKQCNGHLNMDYLVNSRSYLSYLKKCEENCQAELTLVRQDVNQARLELVEARKECKAMEQLKKKDRERYDLEELAKEQKFLDEIGIATHRRKRR